MWQPYFFLFLLQSLLQTAEITGFASEEAFDCSLVETFIVPSMQESVQEVLGTCLLGNGGPRVFLVLCEQILLSTFSVLVFLLLLPF
jgi:hypothetical protein